MGKEFSVNPANSGHGTTLSEDGLTPSQERAIAALLECCSIAAAARQAEVGERSIRRWLREDERFHTKLRQLRQAALSHASLRLQQGVSRAVEAMLNLIGSEKRIEPGRASLVRAAIDLAFRSGAYSDLAERIATLENTDDRRYPRSQILTKSHRKSDNDSAYREHQTEPRPSVPTESNSCQIGQKIRQRTGAPQNPKPSRARKQAVATTTLSASARQRRLFGSGSSGSGSGCLQNAISLSRATPLAGVPARLGQEVQRPNSTSATAAADRSPRITAQRLNRPNTTERTPP